MALRPSPPRLFEHRFELLGVVGVGRDILCTDHLRATVHHGPAVVALLPAVGRFERLTLRVGRIGFGVVIEFDVLW